MAALSMTSALMSIALSFAKKNANDSIHATVGLLLITAVLYLLYCIPAFRSANKRRKRAERLLSAVRLEVPSDVLLAARIRCEAYDSRTLLDMLEESGLDVDDYRQGDSSETTKSDIFWLTLNWLQAYPQKFDHLLIELKEEVYSAYFLYAEIDKKDRASVVSEAIEQIAQLHNKAMDRTRPNRR
ncbi:MAG: hypothetical protein L0H36_01095 [bacterium]|nr:hypothetical protein [bacterium]